MKIILRHIAYDFLATGYQLQRRNISAMPGCCFCGKNERVEHCFVMCQFAASIRKGVKHHFDINLGRKHLINANQWLFDLLHRCNEIQAIVVAVVCWHIWKARNEVRNYTAKVYPTTIVKKVLA